MDSTHSAPFAGFPTPPVERAQERARPFDHPLVWLGALEVLSLGAALLPVRDPAAQLLGALVLTAAYVWLVVRFSASLGRFFNAAPARPMWQVLAATIFCAGLWAASEFAIKPYLQGVLAPYGFTNPPPFALRFVGLLNYTWRPLMLVSAAACGGVALSRMVRYPNMLGPLAGVSALIDIWGVLFGGIVSQLLASQKSAPIAERAMASLPTLGGGGGAGAGGAGGGVQIASVGAGDFLFLGLFFGILFAHRMETRQVVWIVAPLVTLALLAVASGVAPMLPGLLFIGLGAALPNLKYLRYTREERFALLYAGGFVILLTVSLYFAIIRLL